MEDLHQARALGEEMGVYGYLYLLLGAVRL